MRSRALLPVGLCILIVAAVWMLGRPGTASSAEPGAAASRPGRFAVASSGEATVLVDTAAGKTWLLVRPAGGKPLDAAWLPIRRIDDRDEAAKWMAVQEAKRSAMQVPGNRD